MAPAVGVKCENNLQCFLSFRAYTIINGVSATSKKAPENFFQIWHPRWLFCPELINFPRSWARGHGHSFRKSSEFDQGQYFPPDLIFQVKI